MSAPLFQPFIERRAEMNGTAGFVGLHQAPATRSLSAFLSHPDASRSGSSTRFIIESIAVIKAVEKSVMQDPLDLPPGTIPQKETIIEFEERRRVAGTGPIDVRQGEIVHVNFGVENLSADFAQANRRLSVQADGWSPVEIGVRFFNFGVVALGPDAVALDVMQGTMASGAVTVRWLEGPATSVFCATHGLSVGQALRIGVDMTSPETVIPVEQTIDVPFTLHCGTDCVPGQHQLEAFLTGWGSSPTFLINLNVLSKPPPPPSTDISLPGGYILKRDGHSLRMTGLRVTPLATVERETIATVSVRNEHLTDAQKDEIVAATQENIKEYFRENGTNFTAAQAGAAIYGAASAAAIAMTFGPTAAIPFVGPAAIKLGSNVGEFYGSIVDDMVVLLKGESEANIGEFVGTMATLFFTQVNPVFQGVDLIRFMGADGWSLTKEIGEAIGSGLEPVIDGVGSVVGDVIDAVGGALGDAVDFVTGIF